MQGVRSAAPSSGLEAQWTAERKSRQPRGPAMRPLLVAALVLGIALAGCSDGGADGAGGDPAVGATGTTGVIRGLIVDGAIRPLAGANVTASGAGGEWNASADANGLFGISGLAPGVYLVTASKPFHIPQQTAVDVRAGVEEPELVKFELTFEPSSIPYANLYKLEGHYECGAYTVRICSNVNILTWVIVCAQTNVCVGNVTQDRSLFFQWVEPGLDFLQTEMTWEPTTAAGVAMSLLIGGGNEEELKEGVSLPAYNGTSGPSPLMLRVSNHEAEDAWCRRNEQCETTAVINESKIGTERALLVQVDTGPTFPVVDECGVDGVYDPNPCGAGFSMQQPYTLFTIAFYGYEPPADWLFVTSGAPPPPPPP